MRWTKKFRDRARSAACIRTYMQDWASRVFSNSTNSRVKLAELQELVEFWYFQVDKSQAAPGGGRILHLSTEEKVHRVYYYKGLNGIQLVQVTLILRGVFQNIFGTS